MNEQAIRASESNIELSSILALTRRLPIAPGMKLFARYLAKWYLRKPRSVVESTVFGYETQLNPHECVESELLFWPQLFDWREISFLRKVLQPGDVFLDLGSNVGGYTLALAPSLGDKGLVISVDADPYSANCLQQAVLANKIKQVRVENVGLSDQVSELTFTPQITCNRGGGSFLSQSNEASILVKCITLTGLLSHYPEISCIKAAKLDLEGFEYRVLKCFFREQPQTLWPKVLLVERSDELLTMSGGDVNALLAGKGYRLALAHGENFIWKI